MVQNEVNLAHNEVIKRILISLVEIEKLGVEPADDRSNRESEGSEEE